MEKKTGTKQQKKEIPWEFSIRTDLAIEAKELAEKEDPVSQIEGVTVQTRETEDVLITYVSIDTPKGAKAMGKPIGRYITIESEKLKENDVTCHEEIMKLTAESIVSLIKGKERRKILIVGLGNWNITPDALGPKVVDKVLVTRHIKESLPKEIDESVASVAAISPGVMGITGIETGEIVKGLVERLQPDLVIAIDALAARKVSRINATIQMSDTGVAPGSGMGNKRMLLNKESLGVPVIALGVPTVVDAATLVNDTMDRMLGEMIEKTKTGSPFYEMLQGLDQEDKYQLIVDILNPYAGNMFVTPKEVDAVVDRLANIIANAINVAIHPGITTEDLNRYLG